MEEYPLCSTAGSLRIVDTHVCCGTRRTPFCKEVKCHLYKVETLIGFFSTKATRKDRQNHKRITTRFCEHKIENNSLNVVNVNILSLVLNQLPVVRSDLKQGFQMSNISMVGIV